MTGGWRGTWPFLRIGRYSLGLSGWPIRLEGWRRFEYWDRLVIGPVYVLKQRPDGSQEG